MIPWKKFIGLSLQVYKCSKECAKFNGGMTNWKPVVRMIVNQDSGFIYEFFSTSRIQLLLMSMSIRKRTLMQKLVYSISKSSAPKSLINQFFSKTQNHCRGTSSHSWNTTYPKRTRSHCPIYWKTPTMPVLFH